MIRISSGFLFLACLCPASMSTGAELQRVVSQTVGTDELLVAIADPDEIAALSHLSRDSDFSAIAEQAAAYPDPAGQWRRRGHPPV